MIAVSAVLVALLAGLMYVAVDGVSDWQGAVMLAGIALATAGTMIAVDPLRRQR